MVLAGWDKHFGALWVVLLVPGAAGWNNRSGALEGSGFELLVPISLFRLGRD